MNKRQQAICDSIIIITDTREQDLHIYDWLTRKGKNVIRRKLDYGDYSYYVPKNEELGIPEDIYFDNELVIERKNSIEEFIGNLCAENGRRLEAEMRNCKAKMAFVIEDTYDRACLGTYKSQYNRKALLGKLATLEHRYDTTIQFKSRESMPVFVYTYFYYHLRLKVLDNQI